MTEHPELVFEFAGPEHDAELRRLLREIPMPGDFSVSFQREPDFFRATTIEGDVHHTVVARLADSDHLVGLGSLSELTAWINGDPARMGYLSQVRIEPGFRGGKGLLSGGFARLAEVHAAGEAAFCVTTIIEDNRSARRALTTGWPGLPCYREREVLTTLVVPLWRRRRVKRSVGFEIRAGRPEDLPEIAACLQREYAAYQFAPHWTADDLADAERTRGLAPEDFLVAVRGGRIAGCLAVWNQRAFKQTVVHGYGGLLGRVRPVANRVAPWLGLPPLPPPGTELHYATLSHLAVPESEPEMLLSLVQTACNIGHARRYVYVTLCLADRHPHLAVLRRALRHLQYRAALYTVHWPGGEEAVGRLDWRIPHLELATL